MTTRRFFLEGWLAHRVAARAGVGLNIGISLFTPGTTFDKSDGADDALAGGLFGRGHRTGS